LAVDFQLFLISPLFVMVFWKYRKAGWYILCFTLLSAIGVQLWLAQHFHYSMNPFHYSDTKDEYHTVASIKPYTRCVPYLMGLGAAMLFHNEAGRLKRGGGKGLHRGGRGGHGGQQHHRLSSQDSLEVTPNVSGSEDSPTRRQPSARRSGSVDTPSSSSSSLSSSSPYRDILESSNCVLFGFVAAVATILLVVFIPATDYLGADSASGGHNQDSGGHGGSHGSSHGHSHVPFRPPLPYSNHTGGNTSHGLHPGSSLHTVISNWSDFGSVAYAVFAHVAMGLSITFVVLAFSLGHGGWLRELAKAQWWQPLSRLTYGVYLVHPMLIFFAYTASLDLIYFQPLTVVINFIALTILSFIVSFFLFLLITLPFQRIGRGLIWGVQVGHGSRVP
jgi:hypothetical protein